MTLKRTENIIKLKTNYYNKVHEVCQDLLRTHPIAENARQYLSNRVSSNSQDLFEFGYFPNNDNLHLLTDRVHEGILRSLGLIYPYHVQHEDYRVYVNKGSLTYHNIIMPYRDVYGNIKALIGRTILSEEERKLCKLQKYKYTRFNKSLHLFGLHHAKAAILQKKSVILVEGQFDCISCHEYGIHNVVALGGSALTKRQFQLLIRYTDKIYLLLDKDFEGQKAASKIMKKYAKELTVKMLELPGIYKDVDEYLRSEQQGSYILNLI